MPSITSSLSPFQRPLSWALVRVKASVTQSCLTLCDPITHQTPLVHRLHQARILEWFAIPFSRESSPPRDQTWVSCVASRFFTGWATREAPSSQIDLHFLLNMEISRAPRFHLHQVETLLSSGPCSLGPGHTHSAARHLVFRPLLYSRGCCFSSADSHFSAFPHMGPLTQSAFSSA